MAKFVITEEQYKLLKEWGTDSLSMSNDKTKNQTTVNVTNSSGDPGADVNSTAKKLGNPKGVKYVVSAERDSTNPNGSNPAGTTTVENRVITKKELTENHFKHLRKNSKLYTVKDFLTK